MCACVRACAKAAMQAAMEAAATMQAGWAPAPEHSALPFRAVLAAMWLSSMPYKVLLALAN